MTQLDFTTPSGTSRPQPDPDESGDRFSLRQRVWDVVGGEQERLYEVAAAIGVPSYWLSAYVRGDADPPDGAVVGRLYRLALGQVWTATGGWRWRHSGKRSGCISECERRWSEVRCEHSRTTRAR